MVRSAATVSQGVPHGSRSRVMGRPGREESLLAGFVTSPWCNFAARDVSRPQFTLLYLLEGRGEFGLGRRSWQLTPGTLVLRAPGVVHTVVRDRAERWVEFFVAYPDSVFALLRDLGLVALDRPVVFPGVSRLTWTQARSLFGSVHHDSGVSTAQLVAESQAFLAHLLDLDRSRREGSDEAAMVRRARDVLARDLDQPLDMPSVAAGLGIGYETFRKAFARLQGVAPKEYRIRRRIDSACHLLTLGKASVKQTAMQLGYPDVPSFVKQFRRVMGVPPAHFRDLG